MADKIESVYRLVGAKIEHVRSTLGWSQADLAKKVLMTRCSVTNIEAGRQRLQLHTIEAFATAFGMTPKMLLKGIWL